MQGFDYANARLHAMKSRLLTAEQFNTLADAGTTDSLLIGLMQTPYQPEVQSAMVQTSGLEAVALALSQDLIRTVQRIRTFFSGPELDAVALILRSYDVHNVKAILRSLGKHLPAADTLTTLLPIGDLPEAVLAMLADAPDTGAAIDLLASMRVPLAKPLLRLRSEKPGADIADMELALERWHLLDAFEQLEPVPRSGDILSSTMEMEADLVNLLTVIRLTHAPVERTALVRRLETDDLSSVWVGPGRLSPAVLGHAADQNTLEAAVEALASTPYREPLLDGLARWQQSGQFSEFEKALRRFRLRRMARLIVKDPLGIGVLLGYLALKVNEIGNLRWIAHAIQAGLSGELIRAELEVIS